MGVFYLYIDSIKNELKSQYSTKVLDIILVLKTFIKLLLILSFCKDVFFVGIKEAALKWKALEQEQKSIFIEKHALLYKEYDLKMIEWEVEMAAEGHIELCRKKFVKLINKELKKLYNQKIHSKLIENE